MPSQSITNEKYSPNDLCWIKLGMDTVKYSYQSSFWCEHTNTLLKGSFIKKSPSTYIKTMKKNHREYALNTVST